MSLPRMIRAFEIAVIKSMICYLVLCYLIQLSEFWLTLYVYRNIYPYKQKVLSFLQMASIKSVLKVALDMLIFLSLLLSLFRWNHLYGNKCFFSIIILHTTLDEVMQNLFSCIDYNLAIASLARTHGNQSQNHSTVQISDKENIYIY